MKINSKIKSTCKILENTELLFEMVFNQQFQFIAILSPEGRVLRVNKLALALEGVNQEDYIGKFFWKLPPWCDFPESEKIWKNRLTDVFNLHHTIQTENLIELKNGSINYIDSATTGIYDPITGMLAGYVIQTVDTTKHRLNEINALESEARLKFLLEHSYIGDWELNLVDHTTSRSPRHDEIFGYNSLLPHWTYEKFLEHVILEDRSEVDKKFQEAIKKKTDWNFECRIVRNDGCIRWILASGGHAIDTMGQVKKMAGIVQDITEIKQAELEKIHHSAELHSLFTALPDIYFRLKPNGTILDYQARDKNELFIDPNGFIGKYIQDILPKKMRELFQSKINKMVHSEKTIVFNTELMLNNKMVYFDIRLNRIVINNEIVCIIRDVTEEYNAKESLAISEERYQSLFNNAEVPILSEDFSAVMLALDKLKRKGIIDLKEYLHENIDFAWDLVSLIKVNSVNTATLKLFGANSQAELITKHNLIFDIDSIDILINKFNAIWTKQETFYSEINLQTLEGKKIEAQISFHPSSIQENDSNIPITFVDITERKHLESKLKLSSRVYKDTREGIMITDIDKNIIDINPAFINITGYTHEDVIGHKPHILSSDKQSSEFYTLMWREINEQGYWQGEIWNKTKSGELYAELLTISSLKDSNGYITNYLGIFSDITNNKRQQENMRRMAHYDALTRLPNRTLLSDRFKQARAHSKRSGTMLAVCFLDLDDFKPVNDTFGHDVGDKLLIEVSQRLELAARTEDTVSRLGGDEFSMLLGNIETKSQCYKALKRIINSISATYFIDEHVINISASIGVSLSPLNGVELDPLLRQADQAMYHAKQRGKKNYHLFDYEQEQQKYRQHIKSQEVQHALNNGELCLYYQPKVNMTTGEITGVEALIRWLHPTKGIIYPLNFLPFIEGTEVEIQVGDWVIDQAMTQLEILNKQGINIEMSVNVSSIQFLNTSFYDNLNNALIRHKNIDAFNFNLEVIESTTLGDLELISDVINKCHGKLGVNISLDDFGTGYSSLSYIRQLSADTIKIDNNFIHDLLVEPNDFVIVDAVIGLTKAFNRNVIAEGVETIEDGLMLILMGCTSAQGNVISKPIPSNKLVNWLNEYQPIEEWVQCITNEFTPQEIRIKQLELILHRCIQNIEIRLFAPFKEKIDTSSMQCYFEQWIKRLTQERLFENTWVKQLQQTYNETQKILDKLISSYNTSCTPIQEQKLNHFRSGCQQIHSILNTMSAKKNE